MKTAQEIRIEAAKLHGCKVKEILWSICVSMAVKGIKLVTKVVTYVKIENCGKEFNELLKLCRLEKKYSGGDFKWSTKTWEFYCDADQIYNTLKPFIVNI